MARPLPPYANPREAALGYRRLAPGMMIPARRLPQRNIGSDGFRWVVTLVVEDASTGSREYLSREVFSSTNLSRDEVMSRAEANAADEIRYIARRAGRFGDWFLNESVSEIQWAARSI